MRPLPTNYQVLTWLCICPVDKENQWKKPFYILISVAFLAINVFGFLTSGAFVLEYLSTDLKMALHGLYQVCAFLGITQGSIILFMKRKKITEVFETLSTFYNEHKEDESAMFLSQANAGSERIWKYYLRVVFGGLTIGCIVIFNGTLLYCWHTNRPLTIRYMYLVLPWDQETKIGYFLMSILCISFGDVYLILNGATLLLFMALSLHHRAFYKIFHSAAIRMDQPNQNIRDILCDMVRFHSLAKEWFLESTKVYSPFVLIELFCCIIFMACCVFQIDLQLKHFDHGIFIDANAFIVNLGILFCYCYYGKKATESYERMADCLFESNWIEYPIHLQKYLIFMIRDMQKPHYYHGFGIAVLNLETFTSMLSNTYKFYALFKTITK